MRPKKPVVHLTPEQIEANKLAIAARQAELKAEQERIALFGAAVKKMSDNQLRGELRGAIRRERRPDPETRKMGHHAGLTVALASVLLTVLDNTQSPTNPRGTLTHYLNPAKAAKNG